MDLFLNLLKYSQKFPNLYFCEIFEVRSLETHIKSTSGYLLCDKASLNLIRRYWGRSTIHVRTIGTAASWSSAGTDPRNSESLNRNFLIIFLRSIWVAPSRRTASLPRFSIEACWKIQAVHKYRINTSSDQFVHRILRRKRLKYMLPRAICRRKRTYDSAVSTPSRASCRCSRPLGGGPRLRTLPVPDHSLSIAGQKRHIISN